MTITTQRPTRLDFHDGDGDLIGHARWIDPITPRTPGFWEVILENPMGSAIDVPGYTVHGHQTDDLTAIVGGLWSRYRLAHTAFITAQKDAQELVARANGFDLAEGPPRDMLTGTAFSTGRFGDLKDQPRGAFRLAGGAYSTASSAEDDSL